MDWLELHKTLPRHRKIMKLKRLLKIKAPQAVGHVVMLWLWCLDNARDGDLSKIDAEDIAEVCDWPKKRANELVAAMQEAEWIDADMRLHDWGDYSGRFVDQLEERRERERERKAQYRERKRTAGNEDMSSAQGQDVQDCPAPVPRDNADMSQACPGDVPWDSPSNVPAKSGTVPPLHNITGQDITGQILSSSCSFSRVRAGQSQDSGVQESAPVPRDMSQACPGDVPSPTADPELGKVMSFYLDRINANPSQTSIDELKAFAKHMEPAVIIKAMEYALDEHKAAWSYIKGTLQAYQAKGIRTLSDWQREKDDFEKRKGEVKRGSAKGPPATGDTQSRRRFKSAMDGFD